MMDFILAFATFLICEAGLIFGVFILNKILSENYNTRFDEPPFFLRARYQVATFFSLTFLFFVPVFKELALLNQGYEAIPWYGNKILLILIWAVLTFCVFAFLYINDENR